MPSEKTNTMRKGKKRVWIIIGAIVVAISAAVMIILPPSLGKMPQYTDKDGKILENSVAEKIFIEINGAKIGMFITGKDVSKPVLLFLGGGPGIPEYFLECEYPTNIAEEFVVCYPEYRGSSLSYDPSFDMKDMTTEQYISDVVEITGYLRERFGREKIFIMGHSFGTSLALRTVARYPEYYYAYFAMSQGCDQMRSEYLAYDYMLAEYEKQGNKAMADKMRSFNIRESYDVWKEYARSTRDTAMHELGVGSTRDMRSVITGIFFPSLRCTVYTPAERINIWRGKAFLADAEVVNSSFNFNAFEEVRSLDIPIYFLAGKYDRTCCYDVQREYFEAVEAPEKEFFTFENSAHSPLFEEPERAVGILKEIADGKL